MIKAIMDDSKATAPCPGLARAARSPETLIGEMPVGLRGTLLNPYLTFTLLLLHSESTVVDPDPAAQIPFKDKYHKCKHLKKLLNMR